MFHVKHYSPLYKTILIEQSVISPKALKPKKSPIYTYKNGQLLLRGCLKKIVLYQSTVNGLFFS